MTIQPSPEPLICTKEVPFAPSSTGLLILHPDAYAVIDIANANPAWGQRHMLCPNCGYRWRPRNE